jgi:hypothetical protein
MTSADEGSGTARGGILRILMVLAIGTLALAFRRRRRGGGRQGPAHAKDTRRPNAVPPGPPGPPDGNPGLPGLPGSQSPPWLDAEAPAIEDAPGRRGGGRHAAGRESSGPTRNQGSHRAPAGGSIVADASEQAAEIWREARDQAATSLADAEQEASELVRRASDQAAVTLAAAERQAAEIRANVLRLSTELNESAASEPAGPKPGRQASRTPGPTNLWPYA